MITPKKLNKHEQEKNKLIKAMEKYKGRKKKITSIKATEMLWLNSGETVYVSPTLKMM